MALHHLNLEFYYDKQNTQYVTAKHLRSLSRNETTFKKIRPLRSHRRFLEFPHRFEFVRKEIEKLLHHTTNARISEHSYPLEKLECGPCLSCSVPRRDQTVISTTHISLPTFISRRFDMNKRYAIMFAVVIYCFKTANCQMSSESSTSVVWACAHLDTIS